MFAQVEMQSKLFEGHKTTLEDANCMFVAYPRLGQVEIELSIPFLISRRCLISRVDCGCKLVCRIGKEVLVFGMVSI